MRPSKTAGIEVARLALAAEGISWSSLILTADQIVLFGSTAMGLEEKDSDIDLLCVGAGRRTKSRTLDIKWVSREKLFSDRWLCSELATHIAAFGVWLYGTDDWSEKARVTEETVVWKRRLLTGRSKMMASSWRLLDKSYRLKHAVKLRRDLQRLEILKARHPVVPTPLLDFLWRDVLDKRARIGGIVEDDPIRDVLCPKTLACFEPELLQNGLDRPLSEEYETLLQSAALSFAGSAQ